MLALVEWETDRCPCGCGQAMSECLTDSTRENNPVWQAAYLTCDAGRVLRAAMAAQHDTDQAEAERTGKPVSTHHRIWQISKREEVPHG